MKNLDFKMRERFQRWQQDEDDRRLERENKRIEKIKAALYDEKLRECGGTPEDLERIEKYFEGMKTNEN